MSRENTPDPKKDLWETAETPEAALAKAAAGYVLTTEEQARMCATLNVPLSDPERLYALAMRQASPVQHAHGMLGSGVVPLAGTARTPMGATERDIAWVWEHLPAGSTIYVSVRSDTALLAPERMPVEEANLSVVPCLRSAALAAHVSVEANQREAEAAVTLLSVLAYGDRDAIKAVVVQGVSGP